MLLIAGVLVGWYVVGRAIWIVALWPAARRDDRRFRARHPHIHT